MYFYLGYAVLLYFAFILFPRWFSHVIARATGGWLLIPEAGSDKIENFVLSSSFFTYAFCLWLNVILNKAYILNCLFEYYHSVLCCTNASFKCKYIWSNQSILKEISPWISLEGMMLKLKFQYFDHLMRRVDSLEKTLMLGGIGGRRRKGDDRGWDGWMASPTRWMWVWVNSGSWWWTGRPGMLQFMGSQRVGQDWATELNWTEPAHNPGLPCGSNSKEFACNAEDTYLIPGSGSYPREGNSNPF